MAASASAGPAEVSPVAGPADLPGSDSGKKRTQVEAASISCEGRLYLDKAVDGKWWLTDILTHESTQIPGDGPWELLISQQSGR